MTAADIREILNRNEIIFREELPEMLQLYLSLLLEWNSRMDLIADAEEEEIADRHFADSLTVLKAGLIKGCETMIDVGTGAGFPGMVLAMACPEMNVTLLDAQRKRLGFLEAVIEKTKAENVSLIHARAEDGARRKELRESFDIACARALAPANVLCEYLLPFVKTGGYALCWKGPALKDEIESGRRAAHVLGGRLEMPVSCPVAGRNWEHMILPVLKTQRTPALYPRKAGTPKNKPLGV